MNRITVKDAATILGVSEQYVRVGMQRGWLPIGSCVKLSSKWTYHIPEERLMAYLEGRDIKSRLCGNTDGRPLTESAERTW